MAKFFGRNYFEADVPNVSNEVDSYFSLASLDVWSQGQTLSQNFIIDEKDWTANTSSIIVNYASDIKLPVQNTFGANMQLSNDVFEEYNEATFN